MLQLRLTFCNQNANPPPQSKHPKKDIEKVVFRYFHTVINSKKYISSVLSNVKRGEGRKMDGPTIKNTQHTLCFFFFPCLFGLLRFLDFSIFDGLFSLFRCDTNLAVFIGTSGVDLVCPTLVHVDEENNIVSQASKSMKGGHLDTESKQVICWQ
jgi:hypothetical protein